MARLLRMKNFYANDPSETVVENSVVNSVPVTSNGAEIKISENYFSFSKSREHIPLMQHSQNIKCVFKDKHDEEQKEEKKLEDQELKFKFAALVLDKLFFFISLIYSILTFIGLILSM